MRMGVPASSANCLDGAMFFVRALGAELMRVPRPAAGIITTTFMAGCQYTGRDWVVQISIASSPRPEENALSSREREYTLSRPDSHSRYSTRLSLLNFVGSVNSVPDRDRRQWSGDAFADQSSDGK